MFFPLNLKLILCVSHHVCESLQFLYQMAWREMSKQNSIPLGVSITALNKDSLQGTVSDLWCRFGPNLSSARRERQRIGFDIPKNENLPSRRWTRG